MTQSSDKPTVPGLLDFYTKILSSLALQVDEQGLISMDLGGAPHPSSVGEKRMVLPTQEIMRAGDWTNFVAFHPLSENMYRGESPVLKKLRGLVNFRLMTTINTLVEELTHIAVSKDLHEKLSPKQSELLSHMPDADEKTKTDFTKVLDTTSVLGDRRVVSIYLKRGGRFKGEEYYRVGVTSFPITEEFDNEDRSIYGVKLRVKDFKAFQKLFFYIVPDADNLEKYSYGSRSMEAPYFDALMKAYLKVAKQLNKITRLFRKHLSDPDGLLIDVSWEDKLDDLAFYRDLIPTLSGNDGELSIDEKQQAAEQQANGQAPQESSSVFNTPKEGPPPWQVRAAEAINNADTSAPPPPLGVQQAVQQSAPVQQPFQQPQQWNNQPVQPQQQSQPVAQNSGNGNGLSWSQVMAQKNQPQPIQPQQGMWNQPQQAPPGFAGEPYTPQQVMSWQQPQQQPQSGFANHPRNQQQGGMWNQGNQQQTGFAWQQNGPVYPNGVV